MNQTLVIAKDFWLKHRRVRQVLIIVAVFVLVSAITFGQTATAVPEIEIPTGDMITNLNTWIAIFAPIMLFIGMIPVALGLLRYITNLFRSAFGGG